jgi:hypothetical protein
MNESVELIASYGIKSTLSINELLVLFASDVDIFLLQNKEQTADLEKDCFNKAEIRERLKQSLIKITAALDSLDYDIYRPIQ